MGPNPPLRHSPLHDFHLSAGAKMADFGGWEMPIEYPAASGGGVLNEHQAVRQNVGLFDVSHLGKVSIKGDGAVQYLNSIFTNDLSKISDGQAQYTLLCDQPSGGVVDDLIAYRHSEKEIFLIPNAANSAEVLSRISANAPHSLTFENQHTKYAVIAVQGPKSIEVLRNLGVNCDLEYMSFSKVRFASFEIILCRTGYTGELGFEILTKWEEANTVWNLLHEEVKQLGGVAAALGARDTLRTEMGYPLHGHELSLEITPVEASASWAVSWEKEFWGKSELLKQKTNKAHRVLQGIQVVDRGIPRAGMQVLDQSKEVIGVVTSGTFSPTLKTGIALVLFNHKPKPDQEVLVDVRGRMSSALVKRTPFVPSHVK